MIKTIIWDYNGTLLDDVDNCISCINAMLDERCLKQLSYKKYREMFSFPVIDYYKAIGFDLDNEDWNSVASEFITRYNALLAECSVFPNAVELLNEFKSKGMEQYILSSMEINMLLDSARKSSISGFFRKISGLDNIYAESKIEIGKKLISENNIQKDKTCLIGDTVHDFEVAESLGINCCLISKGHQSREILDKTGCRNIIDDHLTILDITNKAYNIFFGD